MYSQQQLEKRYFECRTVANHRIDHGDIIRIFPVEEEVRVEKSNGNENAGTIPLAALGDEDFIEEVLDNPVHWKEVTHQIQDQ
jgi:hypothetical protein